MVKCRICNNCEATKKNSHQLPSFLAVMVSSDGDYKRDKELMFIFDKYRSTVYAHGLSSEKWNETFENLKDERIRQISINPISEDYVFCPQCEKMLGDYLESPYSSFFKNGKKIAADIPLMFWISVVWRLSTQGKQGFSLGKDLNEKLRRMLHEYLQRKSENTSITDLLKDSHIAYRLIRCKDFCRENAGFIHCRYDDTNKFFAIIVGDVSMCMNFEGDSIPVDFSCYGIEEFMKNTPINRGTEKEKWVDVSTENYQCIISKFVQHAVKIRAQGLLEIADEMWKRCEFFGYMPIVKKIAFAEMVVSANAKIGDRYSPDIYVKVFREVVTSLIL